MNKSTSLIFFLVALTLVFAISVPAGAAPNAPNAPPNAVEKGDKEQKEQKCCIVEICSFNKEDSPIIGIITFVGTPDTNLFVAGFLDLDGVELTNIEGEYDVHVLSKPYPPFEHPIIDLDNIARFNHPFSGVPTGVFDLKELKGKFCVVKKDKTSIEDADHIIGSARIEEKVSCK